MTVRTLATTITLTIALGLGGTAAAQDIYPPAPDTSVVVFEDIARPVVARPGPYPAPAPVTVPAPVYTAPAPAPAPTPVPVPVAAVYPPPADGGLMVFDRTDPIVDRDLPIGYRTVTGQTGKT